jgi:hypothetical protein
MLLSGGDFILDMHESLVYTLASELNIVLYDLSVVVYVDFFDLLAVGDVILDMREHFIDAIALGIYFTFSQPYISIYIDFIDLLAIGDTILDMRDTLINTLVSWLEAALGISDACTDIIAFDFAEVLIAFDAFTDDVALWVYAVMVEIESYAEDIAFWLCSFFNVNAVWHERAHVGPIKFYFLSWYYLSCPPELYSLVSWYHLRSASETPDSSSLTTATSELFENIFFIVLDAMVTLFSSINDDTTFILNTLYTMQPQIKPQIKIVSLFCDMLLSLPL